MAARGVPLEISLAREIRIRNPNPNGIGFWAFGSPRSSSHSRSGFSFDQCQAFSWFDQVPGLLPGTVFYLDMASRCWHLEQLPGLASMSGLAASPCNLHALWLAVWTLEESGAPPLGVPPVRPTLAFQASYHKQANRDHAIVPYCRVRTTKAFLAWSM